MKARIVTAALLLTASLTPAAQFQAFDRAEQIRSSDVVLKGRVLSVHSEWNEDGSAIQTLPTSPWTRSGRAFPKPIT